GVPRCEQRGPVSLRQRRGPQRDGQGWQDTPHRCGRRRIRQLVSGSAANGGAAEETRRARTEMSRRGRRAGLSSGGFIARRKRTMTVRRLLLLVGVMCFVVL